MRETIKEEEEIEKAYQFEKKLILDEREKEEKEKQDEEVRTREREIFIPFFITCFNFRALTLVGCN
jgi:hypothetical protein